VETTGDYPAHAIDELIDAAMTRALSGDELAVLEHRLLECDDAIDRLIKRCQLECDLRSLMGSGAATKLSFIDGDPFAHEFKCERLSRPADRAQ
jgi:hypothetical protein